MCCRRKILFIQLAKTNKKGLLPFFFYLSKYPVFEIFQIFYTNKIGRKYHYRGVENLEHFKKKKKKVFL